MKSLRAIKLVLIGLIILFWGCNSGELSRGKAAELIKNSVKFPKIESVPVSNTYMIDYNGTVGVKGNLGGGPETKEMCDFFMRKNLMTIAKKYDNHNGWMTVVTGFTDEGKKYAIKIKDVDAFASHTIKLCDIVFNEITGIQTNEQTKTATVEFSLKRINLTPFGEYYKERQPNEYPEIIVGQTATLQKYDDGWRIGTVESN